MKALKVFAVSLLVVGSIFVSAQPANAAYSDCTPGWLCLWVGFNASGNRYEFNNQAIDVNGHSVPDGRPQKCLTLPVNSIIDNNTSSGKNDANSTTYTLFDGYNCELTLWYVDAYPHVSWNWYGSGSNDRPSSIMHS